MASERYASWISACHATAVTNPVKAMKHSTPAQTGTVPWTTTTSRRARPERDAQRCSTDDEGSARESRRGPGRPRRALSAARIGQCTAHARQAHRQGAVCLDRERKVR
eukprot:3884661-Rhodomonas_salina.3